MLDFPFLIERSYCLIKLLVQVQFLSVWNTKWHIVTLLKNIQLSPSMICLMSLKAPLAGRVAKIMAGRLLHIKMRNFFPKVEYFAIWH